MAIVVTRYNPDWCNDDQPYALTPAPSLLSVPLPAEWDDVQCQWLRQVSPRDHANLAVAAFDRLHRECATHRRAAVFGLGLHPWLSGMPSRIAARRCVAKLWRRVCMDTGLSILATMAAS